jgi:hypothetical protein
MAFDSCTGDVEPEGRPATDEREESLQVGCTDLHLCRRANPALATGRELRRLNSLTFSPDAAVLA